MHNVRSGGRGTLGGLQTVTGVHQRRPPYIAFADGVPYVPSIPNLCSFSPVQLPLLSSDNTYPPMLYRPSQRSHDLGMLQIQGLTHFLLLDLKRLVAGHHEHTARWIHVFV